VWVADQGLQQVSVFVDREVCGVDSHLIVMILTVGIVNWGAGGVWMRRLRGFGKWEAPGKLWLTLAPIHGSFHPHQHCMQMDSYLKFT